MSAARCSEDIEPHIGWPGPRLIFGTARRVLTRALSVFRSRELIHLPRSPHQDTTEFAKGWRDAINGVSRRRCPYARALCVARWEDGYETALKARAKRRRTMARRGREAMRADLLGSGPGQAAST
ncbi:MAG: hypothetical protein NVSMB18_28370 [Acetobacteraceae bacterium]